MGIVKANYRPRKGGEAAKSMLRSAKYYQFRDGADQPGRMWRTNDGRTLLYEDAREEIREAAKTYGYSYRVVLSTQDADIGREGYQQILENRFEKYYMIEHHNTEYPHAHVIGFRKQLVNRAELAQMRHLTNELEATKARDLERQPDQERERAEDQEYSFESTQQVIDTAGSIASPVAGRVADAIGREARAAVSRDQGPVTEQDRRDFMAMVEEHGRLRDTELARHREEEEEQERKRQRRRQNDLGL